LAPVMPRRRNGAIDPDRPVMYPVSGHSSHGKRTFVTIPAIPMTRHYLRKLRGIILIVSREACY
jgi:hypothetical protein